VLDDRSVVGCFKYFRIIDFKFKNIELVSTINAVNNASIIENALDGKHNDITVNAKLEI
jgi:hypothetical protein